MLLLLTMSSGSCYLINIALINVGMPINAHYIQLLGVIAN